MIKKLLLLLAIFAYSKTNAQVYGANNFTLCSVINPGTYTTSYGTKFSACWGWYQANKNREYAIAGSAAGTYFVDVTNPYQQVICDFEPGKITGTVWREMKTYQNYCYVVSDDGGLNSFQIFDLQYLPDSVHKVHDAQTIFKRTHAVWIDGNKLYCSSVTYSDNTKSTLNIYSLATPSVPTLIRKLNQDAAFITTVHDTYANNDTVFVSAGYGGLYTFTLTPPSYSFTQVGSLTSYVSSGYNHSSAITPNKKTLVMCDEVPAGLPVKVIDVQNLANMQVLSTYNQYAGGTPHNPWTVNDSLCFLASYCDGLQLLNIKNPNAPFLAGYFDTHPQAGGNVSSYPDPYDGLWGLYPYLPSKNIVAVDEQNGIFVLKSHLFTNTIVANDDDLPPPDGVGTSTGSLPTGINPYSYGQNIMVSPNPANASLFIMMADLMSTKDITFELFDMQGRTVLKQSTLDIKGSNSNFKEINTSQFDNGIYFLRLSLDNQLIKNSKLIIAH
ncbi:MAG: choice-of-anchor B family protein [Sphingobacteriaceae bacterium]|nr:choice-of-anchor B family protein [Sphingobacteriaceae bacterium]